MFKRLLIFCIALFLALASARADSLLDYHRALTGNTHYSLSGQFLVHDLPPVAYYPTPRENTNLVELDPTLLAVSCERIKKNLLIQLGVRDTWRGQIFINLHRNPDGNEQASVAPAQLDRGWIYRLDMPQRMERSRVVSTIVEVLLLEMADRNASQSTQIPTWLSQGMSREVMLASEDELVIEKPHRFENGLNISRLSRTNFTASPLIQTHEELMSLPPMSLEDLSWPKPGQFYGEAGEAYRCNAQLFVHELLQLNDGRQCMLNFLAELPKHLNWQIAFLRAFHSHFATQLEAEKWWALRLVQFTGRDLTQTWPLVESWQKLDTLVHPSVEVRRSPNELPLHSEATLQSIIRDWPIPRQVQLFREKSSELMLLRLRISQGMIYLVDDYRKVLDGYVKKRGSAGVNTVGKSFYVAPLDDLSRETIRALDLLEARRQLLRPNPQIPPAMTASTHVIN